MIQNKITTTEKELMIKANNYAANYKDELIKGFRLIIEAEEFKDMLRTTKKMSDEELNIYLNTHVNIIFDKIINHLKQFTNDMKESIDIFPNLKSRYEKINNTIEIISNILDEKNKHGWKNNTKIQNDLKLWMIKLFLISKPKTTLSDILVFAVATPILIAIAGQELFKNAKEQIDIKKARFELEQSKAKQNAQQELSQSEIKKNKTYIYRNHCWRCYNGISEEDKRCAICGWFICSECGACGCSH